MVSGKVLISVLLLHLCLAVQASDDLLEIRLWERNFNLPNLTLLGYLLDATADDFGPYKFVKVPHLEQGRAAALLEKTNIISLLWFATNPERETRLLPVRVPVGMGLLGYRICMIKKGQQHKFEGIKTLDDWKASGLSIGQGTHWPDTEVLKSNDLNVVTTVRYQALFDMLEADRFDCFARSVMEIEAEIARPESKGFEVEKSLMFVYRMPEFIFLNPDDVLLANRLQLGFNRIIDSGLFNKFIEEYRLSETQTLNLSERTIIYLENPDLTPDTKRLTERPELWYDPSQ